MISARLNGFFPADYAAGEPLAVVVGQSLPPGPSASVPAQVEIADARALQAGAESEAAFFAEHGFVLLDHATGVRDWDSGVPGIYRQEIETVIRERLFPGRRVVLQHTAELVRRGHGMSTPWYGEGVHSDFGLVAEDYATSIHAYSGAQAAGWWRQQYDRDEVEGFVSVNFWRITNMAGPLRHMPLALCEPGSVGIEDLVPMAITGIAPWGHARTMCVRQNVSQRWVSYPGMTGGELLAFKLFESRKSDAAPVLRSCFHGAFRDPGAPADAEPRQSCEHRVGVLVLRD